MALTVTVDADARSLRLPAQRPLGAPLLEPEINFEPPQWQQIWIYRKDGSPPARVLDAVLADDAPEDHVRATLTGIRLADESGLTAEQKSERIRQIMA